MRADLKQPNCYIVTINEKTIWESRWCEEHKSLVDYRKKKCRRVHSERSVMLDLSERFKYRRIKAMSNRKVSIDDDGDVLSKPLKPFSRRKRWFIQLWLLAVWLVHLPSWLAWRLTHKLK